MTEKFSDNQQQNRFELQIDNDIVFADYNARGNTLLITHVEAPHVLRGTGAAGRLMQNIAEKARVDKLKITPICGYAVSWLRRHDDYNDVVA